MTRLAWGLTKAASVHPQLRKRLLQRVALRERWNIPVNQLKLLDQWARASFLDGWLSTGKGLAVEVGDFARRGNPVQIQQGLKSLREFGDLFAKEWTSTDNEGFYENALKVVLTTATRRGISEEEVLDHMQDWSVAVLHKGEKFHTIFHWLGADNANENLSSSGSVKRFGLKAGHILSTKILDRIKKIRRKERQQRELEQTPAESAYAVGHLTEWGYEDLMASLLGDAFSDWMGYSPRELSKDEDLVQYIREPAEELIKKIHNAWERDLSPSVKLVLNAIINNPDKGDRDIAGALWGDKNQGTNVQRARKEIMAVVGNVWRQNSKLADAMEFRAKQYMQQGTGGLRSWVPTYGPLHPGLKAASQLLDLTARVATRASITKSLRLAYGPDTPSR